MHAHLCKHFFLYMNVQLCSIGARLCVCVRGSSFSLDYIGTTHSYNI